MRPIGTCAFVLGKKIAKKIVLPIQTIHLIPFSKSA